MYQNIKVTIEDYIGMITIYSPENFNAITPSIYAEIKDALCGFGINDKVKIIILTGAGKNFSIGNDIWEWKGLIDNQEYINEKSIQLAGNTAEAIKRCPKPVIAMVNGMAAGAGCSLALACDFRIMEPDSILSMAFIHLGLPGDTGGIYYMARLIGLAKTEELIMLGTPVSGAEAVRLGLATRLAPKGKLEETTMDFAARLAQQPMLAIKKQKEMLLQFFYKDIRSFTDAESEIMVECSKSEDFAEAIDALLEKRKPIFQGC